VALDRPLAELGLHSERVLWKDKGPGKFEEELAALERKIGLTTLAKAVAWAQTKSMWPDTFGLACCAIEMMSIVSARYDIARFGMEAFRSSPRQADLLIVSGRVSNKMAAPLRQIYDQMLEPKWVIAMGACASSGGMFNNYAIVQSVDKITPVDIYVPGCPPRPEQLMEGIIRLHEAVQAGVPPAYEIRPVAS
jgi:NADH-quinone oxidoreductase subunit B